MKTQNVSKKGIIKLIIILLIIIFLVIIALVQFVFPLSVKEVYFTIEPFSKEELQIRKNYFNMYSNDIDSSDQFIRTENPFPSDDYTEYCTITIVPVIKNNGFLKTIIQDGFIKNKDYGNKVIYKDGIVVPTIIEGFDKSISNNGYIMFAWRGDMTDEEFSEYIRGLEFENYYETDLQNSKKFNVSLKDAKLITHEELVELSNSDAENND